MNNSANTWTIPSTEHIIQEISNWPSGLIVLFSLTMVGAIEFPFGEGVEALGIRDVQERAPRRKQPARAGIYMLVIDINCKWIIINDNSQDFRFRTAYSFIEMNNKIYGTLPDSLLLYRCWWYTMLDAFECFMAEVLTVFPANAVAINALPHPSHSIQSMDTHNSEGSPLPDRCWSWWWMNINIFLNKPHTSLNVIYPSIWYGLAGCTHKHT